MKKAVTFIALCGLIFAGITTICNASPNWGRFLTEPVVVPVESSSINGNVTVTVNDLRRYLPRPIVIPDSTQFAVPLELASAPVAKDPPIPWIRKTRTSHSKENLIVAAPVAKDPPPHPWRRMTRAA